MLWESPHEMYEGKENKTQKKFIAKAHVQKITDTCIESHVNVGILIYKFMCLH